MVGWNAVEDTLRGGQIGTGYDPHARSDAGRVYFTGSYSNNTGVWSSAFVASRRQGARRPW